MPRVFLLYHYFYPDDVVSARLFADIALDLTAHGYDVVGMPAVRSCHDGGAAFPRKETWDGGRIQRVWRPAWRQASNLGRLGNALFMLAAWSWRALVTRRSAGEVMIVGTDPVLGVLAAIPWRLFRPRSRIIHWCHDVYPQAAVAQGLASKESWIVRALNWLLQRAYRRCDVVVDLGACMRELLVEAGGEGVVSEEVACSEDIAPHSNPRDPGSSCSADGPCDSAAPVGEGIEGDQTKGRFVTVTPWSLVEPEQISVAGQWSEAEKRVRAELFGNAQLGLLYSGNLGRAHLFEPFMELARSLRQQSIGFCYAGRGPRMDELKQVVRPEDENIGFAGFASEEDLAARLSATDIHLVSLRPNWTGTVVPSKFFGALSVGRPVLFAGSRKSAIARWIEELQCGWVLENEQDVAEVADALSQLQNQPQQLEALQQHCWEVYQREFAKSVQLGRLRGLLETSATA